MCRGEHKPWCGACQARVYGIRAMQFSDQDEHSDKRVDGFDDSEESTNFAVSVMLGHGYNLLLMAMCKTLLTVTVARDPRQPRGPHVTGANRDGQLALLPQ